MDSSQDHGAALHGSSSCQVRCCTVQRPQCALLSAADHPRRTGVERSTSSTSSFIASTGTAAACRRPPAQLRRRADATADHMGPVAVQADLVVPPVSFVGPCVCGYRALFFHFIDEYVPPKTTLSMERLRSAAVSPTTLLTLTQGATSEAAVVPRSARMRHAMMTTLSEVRRCSLRDSSVTPRERGRAAEATAGLGLARRACARAAGSLSAGIKRG